MRQLDKHGREICVGDVLRVFHFIGARNKRHYMYKVVGEKNGQLVMYSAHELTTKWQEAHSCPLSYIKLDSADDYEIIDGYFGGVDFCDRPKLRADAR